ncbi:MAG: DUF58 domain-containing protein, partial [Lachnospiraceae bacterium]|nr:DUF58 domain-containing protein [Lachnospiraceae bacterium]
LKGLKVNIDFQEPIIREGDKNALVEVIRNDKALLLPVLQLKFSITRTFEFMKESNTAVTDLYYRNDYFTCRPYQIITRKYMFKATKRGEYKISSIDIIGKDIFMNRSFFANSDEYSSVLVLPGRIPRERLSDDLLKFAGDVVKKIKLMEDPFEFNSIREYQPYDSMNHINWKASAKTDSLMVNTFNTTHRKNVVILVNLDMNLIRNAEQLAEGTIRVASCLTDMFISENIPVALYTNGEDYETGEIVEIEAGCDEGHIRNIDIALARLSIKNIKYPFLKLMEEHIEKMEDSEFIIISNYRKDDFVNEYKRLRKDGINVNLIIPEFARSDIGPFPDNSNEAYKWVIEDAF